MTEKCIVILSGGPDSVATMYWAIAEGYDVYSITFDYGQKGKKEIQIAHDFANDLEIPHKIIDLHNLSDIYDGVTSLVDKDIDISSEFTAPIIVPFRNGVFMAVAVAYADGIGANSIFYGAHANDETNYPDCRREFYEAFAEAARLGTEKPMVIKSAFSDTPKSGILKKGIELGIPLEKTWSCYLSGPQHCGECESCMNRKKAFIEAGIPDTTEYKR